MATWGTVNQVQFLAVTHYDGNENLFPIAKIFNQANILIDTLELIHRSSGYYSATWTPTTEGHYFAVVITYQDALHTIEDVSTKREGFTFIINSVESDIDDLVNNNGIANQVWDTILPGNHDIPHSAGLYLQVVRYNVFQIIDQLIGAHVYSLPEIEAKIQNGFNSLLSEVNDNELKIDNLSAQSSAETLSVISEIQENDSKITAINAKLDLIKNDIIGEINANEIKIDRNFSAILQIQNNTRIVAVVPSKMIRPESGSKIYQFFLGLYDTNGNPETPDLTPTIKILRSDGTIFVAESNMGQDIPAKEGQYYFNLILNVGSDEPVLRIEFKIVENGITNYISRVSEILEYDSTLQDIENKIDVLDYNVDDIAANLNGGNGLNVINNKLNNIQTQNSDTTIRLTNIQSKTNFIPNNTATQDDIDGLLNEINSLPTLSQINNSLDFHTDQIKGNDNRDLTQVYDNERGTDNALLSTDPRLNFLNAPITSRSSHSPSDIWSYFNRTLTSGTPISPLEAENIWKVLTSTIVTPGSFGSLIKNFLDVAVSSRSSLTLIDLISLLNPIAKESTLTDVQTSVINESNENQLLISTAIDLIENILIKTNNLPNSPANENTLATGINSLTNLINNLILISNQIKTKTDPLPSTDIAKESSVLKIPLNPLLETDSRLNFLNNLVKLDVPVSTRAENFPLDYAKKSDINLLENNLNLKFNTTNAKIDILPKTPYFDSKFIKLLTLEEKSNEIIDITTSTLLEVRNLDLTSDVDLSTVPALVWNFSNRTLTESLITEEDLLILKEQVAQYTCLMSSVYNNQTKTQKIACWLNKNGTTLNNTQDAMIQVFDEQNTLLWQENKELPDARGVFVLTKENADNLLSVDKTYTVLISIIHQSKEYKTIQPFFTVG